MQFRSQVRALLRDRGFEFCDDQASVTAQHAGAPQTASEGASPASGQHEDLVQRGLDSSSCDHPSQSLRCTISDNEDFWSSTGSASADAEEALLYRLQHPLCRVSCVRIAVYRARYQFGEPVYPPRALSFEIGEHPAAMQPVPGRFPVCFTDEVQTFVLPACAPLGCCVRVRMHGKVQQQLEDSAYYVAIRHVVILGDPVAPAALPLCRQMFLSRPQLRLAGGSSLPASSIQHPSRHKASQQAACCGASTTAVDEELGLWCWPLVDYFHDGEEDDLA
ncbi:hypothetical protein WJX72_005644 [[Myrmecia] bisecta]|uniref:Uncharacterized protein n=1 Tax=[Myrmecia] bisecta TaxID=41462 RepID=A0AAW1R6H7_9CHLO